MTENSSEKIAIIVPAYNIEKYIEQCLKSLIKQTYSNLEIIVVNDGSKDNTLQIIQAIAKKDNRIQVMNQENQGVSESRNNALKQVTANYIMFVDGDDWLEENACEVAMREMKKENSDVVWFAYIREYEQNSLPKGAFEAEKLQFNQDEIQAKIHRRLFGPYEKEELAHPEKLDVLSPVWGKLYKAEILKGHQFQSLKQIGASGEDTFFNIDVLTNVKKITYIHKNFYHYRKETPNSLTKKVGNDLWQKCKKSYLLMKEIIQNRELGEDYSQALKNRFAIDLIATGLKIKNASNMSKEKYRMLKEILQDDLYQEAIATLDISNMPIHWKVFYWNAKKRIIWIVYLLLGMMSYLASRK